MPICAPPINAQTGKNSAHDSDRSAPYRMHMNTDVSFSIPAVSKLRGQRIIAAALLAFASQGCAAAALPVLASGAILGTEAGRNNRTTSNDAPAIAEAAIATNDPAPEAAAPPVEDTPPQANLSMAELAKQDIANAQKRIEQPQSSDVGTSETAAELPAVDEGQPAGASGSAAIKPVSKTAPGTAQNVAIDPARFAPMSVYVLDALAKDAPSKGRMSAILAEPSSLKPLRLPCGRSKLAVLIDLDPKSGLHDPSTIAPTYDGDALGHLSRLRDAGVKIGWISALTAADAGAVRKGLQVSGLDVQAEDELVLLRYPGDRKQTRRAEFGAAHCLIALAGDERADFDELYDYLLRPRSAVTLEPMIGQGWFLLPALD